MCPERLRLRLGLVAEGLAVSTAVLLGCVVAGMWMPSCQVVGFGLMPSWRVVV